MPQLTRKRSILAKIESTYGTDSVPTGAANAILIKNLNVTPLASTIVGRDLIRPYFGEFDQLTANTHVECDFEVEMAGAGTAGTAPAYGPLLRACAMSETLIAAAVTGTAQAGSTTSITLAVGSSAVDGFYVGAVLTTTGGTGSGQTATITAYNGTTKVASATFSVAPGATTTYSIAAGAYYKPLSATLESVSMYFNVDGVQHKILGARGTVELSIAVNTIPTYKFKFTGIYSAPTDTALPTNVYTAFQTPLVANNTNTSGFSLFSVSGFVLESMMVNINNSVDYRSLIGSEYVQITDRRVNGEFTVEAVSMATFNAFSTAIGTTTGAVSITHGTAAGNKVKIDGYKIDLTQPSYADNNGVNMLKSTFVALPTAGNDEFSIAVL